MEPLPASLALQNFLLGMDNSAANLNMPEYRGKVKKQGEKENLIPAAPLGGFLSKGKI